MPSKPYRPKTTNNPRQQEYYARNRDTVIQRSTARNSFQRKGKRGLLKAKYQLALEDYDLMLEVQDGLCAVCRRVEISKDPRTGQVRLLAVDHDHQTGQVRGLLCSRCNCALGYVNDDILILQAMIAYLESHGCFTRER